MRFARCRVTLCKDGLPERTVWLVIKRTIGADQACSYRTHFLSLLTVDTIVGVPFLVFMLLLVLLPLPAVRYRVPLFLLWVYPNASGTARRREPDLPGADDTHRTHHAAEYVGQRLDGDHHSDRVSRRSPVPLA